MSILFSSYKIKDLEKMTTMWNEVIVDGVAFPGNSLYSPQEFAVFLEEQSIVLCLYENQKLAGFVVIHPNNIGRCGHIANASYCLDKNFRGKNLFHLLVAESLVKAKEFGFKGMQFNAVVVTNYPAIRTYTKNGFEIIGTIRNGFKLADNNYSNTYIMYREL